MDKCDVKNPGQNWYYDRVAGGSLTTITTIKGITTKVCLSRNGNSMLVSPCSTKEAEFAVQKWELYCDAIANAAGDGAVLQVIGSKLIASPWVGKQNQLFDFDEYVTHEKCADDKHKVMQFSGKASSAVKISSFPGMPSKEISVSAWVNAKSGSVFSYGNSKHSGAFALNNVKSLSVMINDESVPTNVPIAGLGWTHVSTSWRSSDGKLTLLVNGFTKFTKFNVTVGKSITPGGCLMLAQQQSSECMPMAGESLDGQISDFQVRSKVLDGPATQGFMKFPIEPEILAKAGRTDSPAADHSLKLSLLTRQYAKQELGIPAPAVCDLTRFAEPAPGTLKKNMLKPVAGSMRFSATGAGHFTTLSGCHYDHQFLGEWTAVAVQKEYKRNSPLTIQFRTSPAQTNCPWCQNGVIAYVDGCAVKYGKDQASASFGGYGKSKYAAFAAMNGKNHKGWKYSASKQMQVNLGDGHFEAVINDGTYIKCSPRSMFIDLPKKYAGKVNGLAGSGEKGKDWTAGPNTGCRKCKAGKAVPKTAGTCHAEFPSEKVADPFNGNSFTKPVAQFAYSWQVDGKFISSAFYYAGAQTAGTFNLPSSVETAPVLELKKDTKGSKEAAAACDQFHHTPTTMQKCVFDFKMFGAAAVKQTQEDLERGQEAQVIIPNVNNLRDTSRYKNEVKWLAEPSWTCQHSLHEAIADMRSASLKKPNGLGMEVPIEGQYIYVLLDQAQARALGLTQESTGYLQFSEIQIYVDSDHEPVIPEKMELLSPGEPTDQYSANNCLDHKKTTDCKTSKGRAAMIKIKLAALQVITKIVIFDTRDRRAIGRNVGANVIITSKDNLDNPVWESEPFKTREAKYTFKPTLRYFQTNMTQSVNKEYDLWKWKPKFVNLGNGSMEIPAGETFETRAKYDPRNYLLVSMDLKKSGPGPISVGIFAPKCAVNKGTALVMNKEKHNLKRRQNGIFLPIHNTTADFTKKQSLIMEVYNGMLKIYLNGDMVSESTFKGTTAPMCVTAGVGPLTISNVNIRSQKAAGKKNVAAEKATMIKQKKAWAARGAAAKIKLQKAEGPVKRAMKLEMERKALLDRQAEAAEGKSKFETKKQMELVQKQEAADCAQEKLKKADHKETLRELKKLTQDKNVLENKKKAIELKMALQKTEMQQQETNIVDSQKNIERITNTLSSAQQNVSKAFEMATNSLLIFQAHASAARSNDTDHKNIGSDASTAPSNDIDQEDTESASTREHEEYLKQAAALREMHRSKAASIDLLHESKFRIVSLKAEMEKSATEDATVKKELEENARLITSLGPIEGDEDGNPKEGDIEEKDAPPMGLPEMVQKLETTPDPDDAFELKIKMEAEAKKGPKPPTALEKQTQMEALADAKMEIQQLQEERKSLKSGDMNPEVVSAQNELAAAEKSGDLKRLAKAEAALKKAMSLTKADLAQLDRAKQLASLELAAEQKHDATKAAAISAMMAKTNSVMDPATAAAKAQKLQIAYEKALADCGGNSEDPSVKLLKAAMAKAKEQEESESQGKEQSAMILAAGKTAGGNGKVVMKDPAVKTAAETGNGPLAKLKTKLQAAQDKNDDKQVTEIKKEIDALPKRKP